MGERGSGVNEQSIARLDRIDKRHLDRLPPAVLMGAEREIAVEIDSHNGHGHAVIAAGDAMVRSAGVGRVAHSITLAFNSSSSCS